MPDTVVKIKDLIKKTSPKFLYTSNENYPIIEKIEIGKKASNTEKISRATHDVKASNRAFKYDATIGAGRPRFASPIYISMMPNQFPIITTLKTVSPDERAVDSSIQTQLKNKIL